jgi:hypothetical protein
MFVAEDGSGSGVDRKRQEEKSRWAGNESGNWDDDAVVVRARARASRKMATTTTAAVDD